MSHRIIISILFFVGIGYAQPDSTVHDIYDRPFVFQKENFASFGGYFEANSNYVVEEGITEGLSFEARRFNIFFYSHISPMVRFFSELEFEHGTEEIALETAIVDLMLHPLFNFRVGVLLPPLGRFNVLHDSPKYNIIDRPLVSTKIIPSTLMEVGKGFFGNKELSPTTEFGYELYFVNGLTDGILDNEDGATRIASGKNEEMFEEDNNGTPSITGRLGFESRLTGEVGLSFYKGVYNSFMMEGEVVDEKRFVQITALDFDKQFSRLTIQGELAKAKIDIPANLEEIFGSEQTGGYVDIGYTYRRGRLFSFDDLQMIATFRFDRVDLNVGKFGSTNTNIGDETTRITVSNSFRPSEDTAFKMVYFYEWHKDLQDNLIRTGGWQFGVATYF